MFSRSDISYEILISGNSESDQVRAESNKSQLIFANMVMRLTELLFQRNLGIVLAFAVR